MLQKTFVLPWRAPHPSSKPCSVIMKMFKPSPEWLEIWKNQDRNCSGNFLCKSKEDSTETTETRLDLWFVLGTPPFLCLLPQTREHPLNVWGQRPMLFIWGSLEYSYDSSGGQILMIAREGRRSIICPAQSFSQEAMYIVLMGVKKKQCQTTIATEHYSGLAVGHFSSPIKTSVSVSHRSGACG